MTNAHKNIILGVVFTLANCLIFLVHGIFWDDFTILNAPSATILEQYVGNGMVWTGYLHCWLQQMPHTVFMYHLLLFIIGLVNVYVYRAILKRLPISETTQWYAALLFAAYPMGVAHMSMICFSYNLGLMSELIAIKLLFRNEKFNILRYALFFIVQFAASMFLPSTIVLIFGVILLVSFLATRAQYSLSWDYLKRYVIKALRLSIYFLPCLVFWFLRLLYFMPIGNYAEAGYNSFSLRKTLAYPGSILQSILNTFDYWFSNASLVFGSIISFVLFLVIAYLLYRSLKSIKDDAQDEKFMPLLIGSTFVFLCGITAYNLVGDVPVYNTMEDRHAILLQIAVPLILSSFIGIATKCPQMRQIIICAISAIFIIGAMHQYVLAIQESQKNDAAALYFANNTLNPGTVWIIDDCDPMESTRFYTYSGIYYRVTGKQDHCFIVNKYSGVEPNYLTPEYNQSEATIADTTNFIMIKRAEFGFAKQVLLNLKDYYLNRTKYNDRVQRMFIVSDQQICTIPNN